MATIAAGHVLGLIDYAVAQGASRDALLAESGVDGAALADHFNRVPLLQYVALLRVIKAACHDPAVALHFAVSSNCADLSIIALIGGACRDVAEAFSMLNRYGRLALDVDGIRGDDHYLIDATVHGTWLIDNRQLHGLCPEATEMTLTRMSASVRRMFDGRFVRAVHFAHPAPAHRLEYERVLGVPVHFSRAHSGILFDPAWFAQPIGRAPRYSLAVLTAHADVLLARLDTMRSTRGRVEATLLPLLQEGGASMDQVAQQLAMSRPTLYRALKAEGVTFEQVLDGLRREVAVRHLTEPGVAVSEVSQRVGFSEPAAFSRAFRRWTGQNPSSYPSRPSIM